MNIVVGLKVFDNFPLRLTFDNTIHVPVRMNCDNFWGNLMKTKQPKGHICKR